MSRLLHLFLALALAIAAPVPAGAEGARVDPAGSAVVEFGEGVLVTLALSQPVPWRVRTLADPARLEIELGGVDWRGISLAGIVATDRAGRLYTEAASGGMSRLVLELAGPYVVARAGMETDPAGATIALQLTPASDQAFRAASATPDAPPPAPQPRPEGPPVVVLDPGHGGFDPGADGGDVNEAALMLTFALELEAVLEARGMRVVLTRDRDVFVPLDARITIARAARADLFLSLHADAVTEGRAIGATVYTLSQTASDEASAALAERHDREDLVVGVDLTGEGDEVATLLMDLARLDTMPRSQALAGAIVEGLRGNGIRLHRRPLMAANFTVLRAPDFPSVLIELGYISSASDRGRLTSVDWRAQAAEGLAVAIEGWLKTDRARAALLRR